MKPVQEKKNWFQVFKDLEDLESENELEMQNLAVKGRIKKEYSGMMNISFRSLKGNKIKFLMRLQNQILIKSSYRCS